MITETVHSATQLATELGFDFNSALERVSKVAHKTPLTLNMNLSRKYQCSVFLKREDLQVVRSYKLRGAYNMMSTIPASHTNCVLYSLMSQRFQ